MRPDWNQYFMGIVFMAAKRSSCKVINAGAILVKDRNIIATGYNGSPAGTAHCLVNGCQQKRLADAGDEAICRGIQAEQNAILQAAKHGTSAEGAILYVTYAPGYESVKMLINAGIKGIYYMDGNLSDEARKLLEEAGVVAEQYEVGG